MMSTTRLESLMNDFAARRQLAPLTRDDEGRYHLRIDDRLDILLFQSGSRILLESSLGPVPQDDPPERLMRILRLQLASLPELDDALTLEPAGETLILFKSLSTGAATLDDLEQALEGFINQLERWTRELSQQPRPSPASPFPAMQMFFP